MKCFSLEFVLQGSFDPDVFISAAKAIANHNNQALLDEKNRLSILITDSFDEATRNNFMCRTHKNQSITILLSEDKELVCNGIIVSTPEEVADHLTSALHELSMADA